MDDLAQKVRNIAEEVIGDDSDLFIVDVKIKGNIGNQKVLVFLDGDEGVNIDRCGKVSRSVGHELEELDFMPGKYVLEVSSPGLDHPIKLNRQYPKNKGRELEVEFSSGEKITGKLIDVSEDHLVLNANNEDQVIRFNEIVQSKILVSFK